MVGLIDRRASATRSTARPVSSDRPLRSRRCVSLRHPRGGVQCTRLATRFTIADGPQPVIDRRRIPESQQAARRFSGGIRRAQIDLVLRSQRCLDADAGEIGLNLLGEQLVGDAGDCGIAIGDFELEAVRISRLGQQLLGALQILTKTDLRANASVEPLTPIGRKCAGRTAAPPSSDLMMPS